MKIFDLTHSISQNMPVYPGTEAPVFETGCSIDEVGFLEKKITMYSHTGTHIDAPAHLIKGSKTLDLFPVDHFCGHAFVLNLADNKNQSIGVDEFEPYQETLQRVDFIIVYTGWGQNWGREKYYSNYPVITLEAANSLSRFNMKGIGFDTISADNEKSKNFPVHKIFLQQDTVIIENLANLENLPFNEFVFSCFPLKFADADGSPVRAVACFE